MASLEIRPLTEATWPAFARLVEAHHGVWGGCWCMGFHARGPSWGVSAEGNRREKEALVAAGQAHAALVFDGANCVGWCQFGATAELPRIKNLVAYRKAAASLPDWRITCFFVAQGRRGEGIAAAALAGALDLIARAGGGAVEGYPEDTGGRAVPGSFLFNGTLRMFNAAGFHPDRPIGKQRWVVARTVAPLADGAQ